jgi:hypothetical protein
VYWVCEALLLFAFVGGPFLAWTWHRFHGSSRALQAFIAVALFFCPGALCLALGAVREADIAWDDSATVTAPARVTALREPGRLFGRRRRYVTVVRTGMASGGVDLPQEMELDAPAHIDHRTRDVVVVAHRGALGLRWVSNLRVYEGAAR